MRNSIKQLLSQKGQTPVISAIDRSIQEFKSMRYERAEIKETIREIFFGLDAKVDEYIIKIGY